MPPTPPRHRTVPLLLWAFVFAATSLSGSRNPNLGDAELMCHAARSLLDHGTLAIEPVRADVVQGVGGKHYTKYPLLTVVQCMPALVLQDAAHKLAPGDAAIDALALGSVPHAIAATLALATWQLGVALGADVAVATWLALIVLFTTPLWPGTRALYGEGLQALLVVWITLLALRARHAQRRSAFAWAGLLCGLAINAKVTLCIMPVAMLVDQWRVPRSRARLWHLALFALPAGCLGVVGWLAYNQLRYGDPWTQGYGAHRDASLGFSVPLASGVYGLLFSSGKGIFFYAPVLLVSAVAIPRWFRSRPRDLWLIAIPSLFTLAVTARWWAWSGDWAWGPRLLLPVVPLACLPLIDALASRSRATRATLGVLAVLGLYVQVLGVSLDPAHLLKVMHPVTKAVAGRDLESLQLRDDLLATHFVPELSPIVGTQWLLQRYVLRPRWTNPSYYPWQSLGIGSWRPHGDPTPKELDFWLDSRSSRSATRIALALGVSTLALAIWLLLQVRATRAAH
jgi:hypothetical protein